MIYGSDEASIEEFIEINDEMDAKSWFIKHLFSGNKVFKHPLDFNTTKFIIY